MLDDLQVNLKEFNMKLTITTMLATALLISGVYAQDNEQKCLDDVAKICGDGLVGDCFSDQANWTKSDPACEGNIQTMIEMEREALAQNNVPKGAALGGKVRSGPGTEHEQIGSLAESIAVNLEYDTGVMFDGYPWFEISYANDNGEHTTGFVWGGILCSNEPDVYGVYGQCPAEWLGMEQEIAPQHSNN